MSDDQAQVRLMLQALVEGDTPRALDLFETMIVRGMVPQQQGICDTMFGLLRMHPERPQKLWHFLDTPEAPQAFQYFIGPMQPQRALKFWEALDTPEAPQALRENKKKKKKRMREGPPPKSPNEEGWKDATGPSYKLLLGEIDPEVILPVEWRSKIDPTLLIDPVDMDRPCLPKTAALREKKKKKKKNRSVRELDPDKPWVDLGNFFAVD
jgi:hypothetical protein